MRTSDLTAFLVIAIAATTACAKLRALKDGAKAAPTPAALSNDSRDTADSHPPALATDDDSIVRILAGNVTCSGTLIEADRVLTAHHCVARRDRAGEILNEDVPAREIKVELGGDYLPWATVGVRAIVAPPCGHGTGDGDIAVLVLDRRLKGVSKLEPRLDWTPKLGDTVNPVGFGRCSLSNDGIRRRNRAGGSIEKLSSTRYRLRAAICPGDSGGPALTDRGDLVGVISASVMDGSEYTRGESEFTRLDQWRQVFFNARLIAEGASRAELPPLDCPKQH